MYFSFCYHLGYFDEKHARIELPLHYFKNEVFDNIINVSSR